MSLNLRNPHSILQALKKRPDDVNWVSVPRKISSDVWNSVETLSLEKNIEVQYSDSRPGKSGSSDGQSSGQSSGYSSGQSSGRTPLHSKNTRSETGGASIEPIKPGALDEVLEKPTEGFGLWLAMDCVQDPHNVGAVFRTAAFFGVRGILTTDDRFCPMNDVVYDTSCGGVELVPFAREKNLRQMLEFAKKNEIWVLGTSEHAKESLHQIKKDRNWLVVMGSEESGIRKLTSETCDVLCSIPSAIPDDYRSLNVSVATGVLLNHLA